MSLTRPGERASGIALQANGRPLAGVIIGTGWPSAFSDCEKSPPRSSAVGTSPGTVVASLFDTC
jgi:hypothetical protein